MAMTANQISTIAAFRTQDGKEFLKLADAQNHTRRSLYRIIHDRGVALNIDFGALPRETLIDFLMQMGPAIASVARDELNAEPPVFASGGTVTAVRPGNPVKVAEDRNTDQSVSVRTFIRSTPDPLKSAMNAVDDAERAEAERRAQAAAKFGKHPLDPAPARSEGMEPTTDGDIYKHVAEMLDRDLKVL